MNGGFEATTDHLYCGCDQEVRSGHKIKFNKLTSQRLTVFLNPETRNSNRGIILLSSKALVNCWEIELDFLSGEIGRGQFKPVYLPPKNTSILSDVPGDYANESLASCFHIPNTHTTEHMNSVLQGVLLRWLSKFRPDRRRTTRMWNNQKCTSKLYRAE